MFVVGIGLIIINLSTEYKLERESTKKLFPRFKNMEIK